MSEQDKTLWTQFVQSVLPLRHHADVEKPSMPRQLRAHAIPARTLLSDLDLHGYTVEEAYQCFKLFLATHIHAHSQRIRVITGKGMYNTGKIKNEIMLWLETPYFRDKIRETKWINDGGVLEIILKRKKKQCQKKK